MIQLVLTSHGRLCEGLLDSLKMVSGDDYGIQTLSLTPGISPEDYREKLSTVLDKNLEKDSRGSVVLSDIVGGTPFNSAMYLRRQYTIGIVSGVSLPMLLTLAIERAEEDSIRSLLDAAKHAHAHGIKIIEPIA